MWFHLIFTQDLQCYVPFFSAPSMGALPVVLGGGGGEGRSVTQLRCLPASTVKTLIIGTGRSQPCTGYKDFCESTVLGTPASVGMNRQIDWQA